MSPVDLRALVREIPDFPQQGIMFKDITLDLVVAAEARGFILGGRERLHPYPVHAVLEYAS